MATFYHYKEDKWLWFALYLELAAAICEHPVLSAKNSDFKDYMREFDLPLLEWERGKSLYGTK